MKRPVNEWSVWSDDEIKAHSDGFMRGPRKRKRVSSVSMRINFGAQSERIVKRFSLLAEREAL